MADKIMHIKDLKHDPKNAREHSSRGLGMLVDSLNSNGAARSIVITEDDTILCGNGTVEAAGEAGIHKVRVVEADGNEIIAVRRRGLTDEQKIDIAISDNRVAEQSSWKGDQLVGLFNDGLKADKYWTANELDGLAVVLDKKEAAHGSGLGPGDPLTLGGDSDVSDSPGRTGDVTDTQEASKNDKAAARMLRFVEKDLADDPDEADRLQPVMVAVAEAIISLYNM